MNSCCENMHVITKYLSYQFIYGKFNSPKLFFFEGIFYSIPIYLFVFIMYALSCVIFFPFYKKYLGNK